MLYAPSQLFFFHPTTHANHHRANNLTPTLMESVKVCTSGHQKATMQQKNDSKETTLGASVKLDMLFNCFSVSETNYHHWRTTDPGCSQMALLAEGSKLQNSRAYYRASYSHHTIDPPVALVLSCTHLALGHFQSLIER